MEPILHLYTGWAPLANPKKIKEGFDHLLGECGYRILGFNEHHFKPHGYTCLWLIAESHLAVHTFPEKDCLFFELCSCNEQKLIHFRELVYEIFPVTKSDEFVFSTSKN